MKKTVIIFSIIIAMSIYFAGSFHTPLKAVKASTIGDYYYNRNVLADLEDATLIDGSKFSVYDYPYNNTGTLRVINIVEYGYSFYNHLNYDYGLVLYLYNPQKLDINANSLSNKIEMAVSYTNGNPNNYWKFNIEVLNMSIYPYESLFYKVRISFTEQELTDLFLRLSVNKNERRYDISSVEFQIGSDIIDYGVTYKMTVTGFSKGLGENATAQSDLSLSFTSFESVELDLHHTYFRNYMGNNISGQLDTVYFAVPNEYIEWYGRLQRIKAEWYEYKLKDILVTSSGYLNTVIPNYLGVPITEYSSDIGRTIATDASIGLVYSFGKIYNPYFTKWYDSLIDTLYLFFYVNEIKNDNGVYSGGVSGTELETAIKNYVNTNNFGNFSTAALFTNNIDAHRIINNEFGRIQKGYSYYDFEYGQSIGDLLGYDHEDYSFLERIKENGLWNAIFHPEKLDTPSYENIMPIYPLNDNDFLGGLDDIEDRLLINKDSVSSLKNFYENPVINGKQYTKDTATTFLFRFAVSEYYSEMASIVNLDAFIPNKWDNQAYFASETIFMDFDIIQLTFAKDGIFTVIPVVSNPIDIVNDIVPPYNMPDNDDWWKDLLKKILFWVAVVVIFLLVFPFLPSIIMAVFNIILLPFRLIIRLFKGGG